MILDMKFFAVIYTLPHIQFDVNTSVLGDSLPRLLGSSTQVDLLSSSFLLLDSFLINLCLHPFTPFHDFLLHCSGPSPHVPFPPFRLARLRQHGRSTERH